ncbi:hypothetical protein DNTS_016942 [Danionella cerebrum]|uniref:Uncharacterized protein n=1 Tax=Danionella cerebrum TaxID=2873325 RepID=A0A553QG03_9TELE|nr:hypothetical protein DNTS_016942 [Danionella translucida]
MGLLVRNLQSVAPLRRARLRRDAGILTHIAGVQRFELGLICLDNRRIQRLNRIYRRCDRPTDVLSFPFHEDVRPGKLPCALHRDEYNLGDIFLGVEFVMGQCRDSSQDFHDTLTLSVCRQVVTAHGICHLLGYRHDTEEEWNEMQERESYILSEFNRLTGNKLEPLSKRCS